MTCRACSETDGDGRPTREALECRRQWGCDETLPDVPRKPGGPSVSNYVDCVRCGGTTFEPEPFMGPCSRCQGNRLGVAIRRCPNAPGAMSPMVAYLRMVAAEAAEARYPAPGPLVDQAVALLSLRSWHARAEADARKWREKMDREFEDRMRDAQMTRNGTASGGRIRGR